MNSLDKALKIVETEIAKLEELSNLEGTLDRSHSSMLTEYIKTLIAVKKDGREQAKGEELPTKSDEELNKLAKEALKYLDNCKEETDDE